MNIRYIQRHLPFRNTSKVKNIIVGTLTFVIAVCGTSFYVVQASAQQSLPMPVSPIPTSAVVNQTMRMQDKEQFKAQQQFCEEQIALFEKQIEATTYLKQHTPNKFDKKKLTEELALIEAKLMTQVKMCNTLNHKH